MKYTFPIILVLLSASTLLFNCDCKHLCSSPSLVLKFTAFDSATFNAVIVKRYNNNGQFNDLHDTAIYTSRVFSAAHPSTGDTMEMDSAGISIQYFNDYIIEVPAANKTWYLRNMSMQATKMNESQCTNGLKYYLNDTLHTIQPRASTSYIPAYIDLK